MNDYTGRVCVITGAGSGLGRELARLAAQRGCRLVLADVQADALAAIERELTEAGAAVLARPTDVSKGSEVEALAAAAVARFGAVHLVFNNAGVATGGLIWENTVADWEWVLGVNLWGVIHGVRVFTPLLIEAARGDGSFRPHMVNTASVAGLLAPAAMGVYNVSKHAVVALTETLYQDLGQVGAPVGVSVLCPGFVPTGIADSQRNRPAELRNQREPTRAEQALSAGIRKAVETGPLTAADVAAATFAAIDEGRFYILTHPKMLPAVQTRFDDILQGRNPSPALPPSKT